MSSLPPTGEPDPSAQPASKAARPGRPRYLVAAVLLTLIFGAGCWTEGCGRLAFYRSDVDFGGQQNAVLEDKEDRARADGLYQSFLDAANRQKNRAVPLAAATFVLGAALLALGSRSLSGRFNTRKLLIQLVAAQAIVVGGSYFALRDMQRAESDWQVERFLMLHREGAPKTEDVAQVSAQLHAVSRVMPPAWLVFRTLASALIVLALTRPRTRAFFDAVDASSPAIE